MYSSHSFRNFANRHFSTRAPEYTSEALSIMPIVSQLGLLMASQRKVFQSTVMMKYIVALSGLAVVAFLIVHLLGNLLLYSGPAAFNKYAQTLRDLGSLLWVARGGLLVAFIAHIVLTIRLKNINVSARPQNYNTKAHLASTMASRSMFWTGLTILCFVLFHLLHFTWGKVQPDAFTGTWILLDGRAVHDAYKMTVAGFNVSWISLSYVIAVTVVFLHLQHAIQSAMQTLGFNHPRYTPLILRLSGVLSTVLWLGFVSLPISVLAGFIH